MTWTDDPFGPGHIAGADLDYFLSNFAASKNQFAGVTSPANPVGGQRWGDETREILRVRNVDNDEWLAVFSGDKDFKKWVYRNDTCDGWVIDTSVTDAVLAIKGGANAYNVDGGNLAGTWTAQGYTLTETDLPSHTHSINTGSYHTHATGYKGGGLGTNSLTSRSDFSHSHTLTETGGDSAHDHGSTFRPGAAVGTLQYPDLP